MGDGLCLSQKRLASRSSDRREQFDDPHLSTNCVLGQVGLGLSPLPKQSQQAIAVNLLSNHRAILQFAGVEELFRKARRTEPPPCSFVSRRWPGLSAPAGASPHVLCSRV